MNISICITTLNEEKSIGVLLNSIFAGTKKPDEVVILDGGSTDATASVINNFQFTIHRKFPNINFQFIKTNRNGIAEGRNLAIQKAKGEIIVQTDAGCVVKKDWLQKITGPFKNKTVDLVAGYYEMLADTPLQTALNVFHGVPPERFDPTSFIPSARSVAFRKSVWEKIGGYNEKLKNAGEDTLFFYEAQKFKFEIERVEKAKVVWQETHDMPFGKSLKKFYNYARGDAKAGIWWHPAKQLESHNIKILLIFLRYVLGLALLLFTFIYHLSHIYLLICLLAYFVWPLLKWCDVVKNWQSRFWLPIVQIASDFAVMSGFISGILGV